MPGIGSPGQDLELSHETTDTLTLNERRRLVRCLLDRPDARTVRGRRVSVDVGPMKSEVHKGLSLLARARKAVKCDEAVLSGIPCIAGTRIPVHDIADMVTNGDSVEAVCEAFPQLSAAQVEAAILYARACPRRGHPHREPFWRGWKPAASSEVALDEVLKARRGS